MPSLLRAIRHMCWLRIPFCWRLLLSLPGYIQSISADRSRLRATGLACGRRCADGASVKTGCIGRLAGIGLSGGDSMQTLGLGFTWEQLSPGQRFRTLNRTITETDLVMFTGVTGMLEVIFTDHTFGGEKGAIAGRFVPAALTYSLIEGLLCQSMIQGTGLAMLELKKEVLAPVRVGDTIHGEI